MINKEDVAVAFVVVFNKETGELIFMNESEEYKNASSRVRSDLVDNVMYELRGEQDRVGEELSDEHERHKDAAETLREEFHGTSGFITTGKGLDDLTLYFDNERDAKNCNIKVWEGYPVTVKFTPRPRPASTV